MKKKAVILAMAGILSSLFLSACGSSKEVTNDLELSSMSFEEIEEKAKGTTVTFYGYGGDEKLNSWLDQEFATLMKDKYDITVERVPMDINQILSQLSGELQAGVSDGAVDMIWINGENFQSAKENGMLFGPFVEKLPNFENYVDQESDEVQYDFSYPVDGYEAPYGKAQLVFMADLEKIPDVPKNAEQLLDFVKKYPGKVTYPAPPDFTGSAFVRNIIYEICGYEQFIDMEDDKETVRKAVEPAMEYLKSLNPYLWNRGETFPDSVVTLKNMFADGEVVMNMTYEAYDVARNIEDGIYSETTQTFLLDKGTVGNTNYIAIAQNSGNKEGAIVAINEMLSPEVQKSRYETLGVIPVLDNSKLSQEQREEFENVDIGKGILPQDELVEKRLPEMPARLVPLIEEIWVEEVVGQ